MPVERPSYLPASDMLLAFCRSDERTARYQVETKRPLVCLIFIFPILLIYEFGMLASAPEAVRNGIDQWLRAVLSYVGLEHFAVLPLATVGTLLYLHHCLHDRWSIRPRLFLGMIVESCLLASILVFAAKAHLLLLNSATEPVAWIGANLAALPLLSVSEVYGDTRYFTFCGAGLYEELVFRVLLFPLLVGLVRTTSLRKTYSQFTGAILVSLFFAFAHCNLGDGQWLEGIDVASFFVRFIASLFFCAVYQYRGFGVAVGTHTVYNVLTIL